MRYDFPVRVVLEGDRERAARFVGEARALLGALVGDLAEAGIRSGARETTIPPDVRIRATFDGTLGRLTIAVLGESPQRFPDKKRATIWLPRGFVLYPASEDAPYGWGFPIVQDESPGASPYTAANTNPGLDTARWTPGGPLGQVLLTRQPNAGYPPVKSFIVPLCFSRASGPSVPDDWRPNAAIGAEYAAFRPRVTGFNDVLSLTSTVQRNAVAASFKRGVFERINAHRVDIGRDPLEQPFYGLYSSAQASADIASLTHTLGHFSDRYPVTYRTPEDRASKDGLRTINTAYPNPDSRNYNYGEIAIVLTTQPPELIGTDPNGAGIYNIVAPGSDFSAQAAFDGWMGSPPHRAAIESTSFDRSGMEGATANPAVHANYATTHFLRSDQWVGCGNRIFECPDELAPISWFGPPSMNLAWETWPAILNTDVDDPILLLTENFSFAHDETVWFANYMSARETDYRPMWSRAVYSAGRCIAYAPGLVWAAGVHKLPSGLYRLIVLTHNETDQPADKLSNGMTPILRYYYCDMRAVGGAGGALSPESIVRGIYGEEDEGWPWDVKNFAYSWRGGTQVDVSSLLGDEVDLLKYRSQWVFDKTATKAACLRDYGPRIGPSLGHRGYQIYATTLYGSFSDGLFPATVKLEFTHSAEDTTHALSFKGVRAPPESAMEQIAVDFDDNGELLYAYRTPSDIVFGSLTPPIGDTDPRRFRRSFVSAALYAVVGVGPWGASDPSELTHRFENTLPGVADWSKVHVLDVKRGAFLGERVVNSFCYVQTATHVISVETILGGQHVQHTSFANPTNVMVAEAACYTVVIGESSFMWWPTLTMSCLVQGFYARIGGEHVIGFNAVPQPNTMFVLNTWPNPDSHCVIGDTCRPTIFDLLSNSHFMLPSELVHLGHFVTASFADTEQLQALVAAPGGGFHTLYARVV